MPFETESEAVGYGGVNTVQLCAYRPSIESKLSSSLSLDQHPIQQVAVEVNRVCLSYGRGNSIKPVLNSISLNVPEAAII
ncbi:hypothetical protein BLA29_007893 [Euroglyphus maynei]|uniref:Uncharacterized protein n=1 Tax=Euroglyphus maynei TaxID=6958 RepID=A0A1Y3AVF8_EURMA|nr:hypothetical protein BLA29_007893 [Euroglyphus maynei]